jgi:hypothetical protein
MIEAHLSQEELIEALKKDGKLIGQQGADGNGKAKTIVEAYRLWHSCPGDNCAFVLCERAYAEWKDGK